MARTKKKGPLLERLSQELRSLGGTGMMKFSSSENDLLQPRMRIAFCAFEAIYSIGIFGSPGNS